MFFNKLGTKEGLMASGSMFLSVATLFVILLGVGAVVSFGLLTSDPANRNNVITVTGTGEAYAVPDVAVFNFTSRHEAQTVKEAQSVVSEQVSAVLATLEGLGIEDKDIKTTSYNSYPRYEWKQERVICNEFGCPPSPGGNRELVAYEQSQSIQVKVRDLDKASAILQALGDAGVDSVNGPNFQVDDEDAVLTEARQQAIAKAKEKAELLADELGVKLGKVVSFSDGGDYYPEPYMMRASFAEDMAYGGGIAPAPEIPAGENLLTASVTVSFKIK